MVTVKSTQPKEELDQTDGLWRSHPIPAVLPFCLEEDFQEWPTVAVKESAATRTGACALIADAPRLAGEHTAGETSRRGQRGQTTLQ